MDTCQDFGSGLTDGDCGSAVSRAVRATLRRLDVATAVASTAAEGAGKPMSDATATLDRLLRAGAFADAVRFCTERAEREAPGWLPRLFLPLIRKLEAEWERDAIEISDLGFAFFQIRRLIEISARRNATLRQLPGLRGSVLLAVPVAEAHGLGIRIVADEMRFAGWQVTLLPEATEVDALQRQLGARAYDALGLSVGHDAALADLADLIVDLRLASRNPRLKVVLGGAALVGSTSGYHFLGAEHVAQDATDGCRALERLVPGYPMSKGN